MDSWINTGAVGLIIGLGLLFGAGLPALFAVGLRAISPAQPAHRPAPSSAGAAVSSLPAVHPARLVAAALCFAVVLAATAWGIYLIVAQGHH
jgi:hypothetical protein